MSLDKAIASVKEFRKPYTGSKRYPATTPAPALNLRNLNVEVTRLA